MIRGGTALCGTFKLPFEPMETERGRKGQKAKQSDCAELVSSHTRQPAKSKAMLRFCRGSGLFLFLSLPSQGRLAWDWLVRHQGSDLNLRLPGLG